MSKFGCNGREHVEVCSKEPRYDCPYNRNGVIISQLIITEKGKCDGSCYGRLASNCFLHQC